MLWLIKILKKFKIIFNVRKNDNASDGKSKKKSVIFSNNLSLSLWRGVKGMYSPGFIKPCFPNNFKKSKFKFVLIYAKTIRKFFYNKSNKNNYKEIFFNFHKVLVILNILCTSRVDSNAENNFFVSKTFEKIFMTDVKDTFTLRALG